MKYVLKKYIDAQNAREALEIGSGIEVSEVLLVDKEEKRMGFEAKDAICTDVTIEDDEEV